MRVPEAHSVSTTRDYLRMLQRRKWLVVFCALLVPAASIFFSLSQERLYRASAEVLLSRQNLAASLTGAQDPTLFQQAERVAQTQAELARVPTVAERVLDALGLEESAQDFLASSGVSAHQNSDLLEFWAEDTSRSLAARLASEYARQFTLYRLELDTAALQQARSELEAAIERLESSGDADSALFASLVEKEQQLRTIEALQTSNAFVVRTANEAVQVQPRLVRNAVLGLLLGIVLGVGVAFLLDTFDTRVRSAEEIGERLCLPLLARLSEPPHRLRAKNRLVMLAEPGGHDAEGFRLLRTNLDFVSLERRPQVVMITSAVQGEGKSTTAANLALALARAGRKIVLVDLDLRRPAIARFFGLERRPGVTDVALGRVALEQAIARLTVTAAGPHQINASGNGNGHTAVDVLEVLPSGPIPPDAGEFAGSNVLAEILDQLRERADLVLIDAPPLVGIGDALTLSARVDGLIVVARLRVVHRGALDELRRVLDSSPAPALGYVVAGTRRDLTYGYHGGSSSYYYRSPAGPSAQPPVELSRG